MKKILNIIKKIALNPSYLFVFLNNHNIYHLKNDIAYLKISYQYYFNQKLNLENPKTFNEKIQWLKLYDRNPKYTMLVDKYEVKNYIENKLGIEYVIPTIGIWNSFDEIDFNQLPNKFVLKCTHDSGGIIVCQDKNNFDYKNAKRKLEKHLKQNFFYRAREWPYKNVKPRIIAEKYMEDSSGGLIDYKFFCFNGYVDNVMICLDRHINDPKFYFFNEKWELLRLNIRGKEAPNDYTVPKPDCIDKMFQIASELSKNIPFVRIDLYECNGCIYFGEFTFFPQGGYDINLLPETDLYFGNLITLENKEE